MRWSLTEESSRSTSVRVVSHQFPTEATTTSTMSTSTSSARDEPSNKINQFPSGSFHLHLHLCLCLGARAVREKNLHPSGGWCCIFLFLERRYFVSLNFRRGTAFYAPTFSVVDGKKSDLVVVLCAKISVRWCTGAVHLGCGFFFWNSPQLQLFISMHISQLPTLFVGTPRMCNFILLLIVWVRSFTGI